MVTDLPRRAWRRIEAALERRGYTVRWQPDAMRRREARLEASLELVLPHLLLSVPEPFFLEIGANDGVANDPLYPFIARGLLRGIMLEPVPQVFEKLVANHGGNPKVRCLNAALAPEDGQADFYTVNMEGISFAKAQQFSSFHRESLLKQTSWVPDIADRIVRTQVRTVSFATLARMAAEAGAQRIDILHTDTEGFDGQVLEMMWQHGMRPAAINFEWLFMNKEEINLHVTRFVSAGYRIYMGDHDMVAYSPIENLGYVGASATLNK